MPGIKLTCWALVVCLLFGAGTTSCASTSQNVTATASPVVIRTYTYKVINSWPHDSAAFTQGLAFENGILYESTGLNGSSSVRVVDLNTGSVKAKADVASEHFAEGLAVLNGKIFQLTWNSRKGFIYDPNSLAPLGEFSYESEGWGLTEDGRFLIMSDGTNSIYFLDPESFLVHKIIKVYDNGSPLTNLNELEYINGEIYANIWHSDKIVRIDPQWGQILGWIDLTGLLTGRESLDAEAVLNGIAYDEAGDRLFVTGKLWPILFEIELEEK